MVQCIYTSCNDDAEETEDGHALSVFCTKHKPSTRWKCKVCDHAGTLTDLQFHMIFEHTEHEGAT